VNIDTVHFPAEPTLDGIIEKRLLQMTRTARSRGADTGRVSRAIPAHRRPAQQQYLQAKVREQHDGW
jgi:hypothetical protein